MGVHIAGNWFISVFKLRTMVVVDLLKVVKSEHYRESTRRYAQLELDCRAGTYVT